MDVKSDFLRPSFIKSFQAIAGAWTQRRKKWCICGEKKIFYLFNRQADKTIFSPTYGVFLRLCVHALLTCWDCCFIFGRKKNGFTSKQGFFTSIHRERKGVYFVGLELAGGTDALHPFPRNPKRPGIASAPERPSPGPGTPFLASSELARGKHRVGRPRRVRGAFPSAVFLGVRGKPANPAAFPVLTFSVPGG